MTRYFAQNTPRAGLEHMMMSVPGFQKRGGGMMILSRFCYKPEDVDCRYCLHYRRRSCQVRTCPYIAERLKSGAIEYLDLILEYFGHIPHAGLHKRIQAVEHWSGPDQAVLHTVSVHLRSRFADRVMEDFIDSAALFSDVFATMGMKIVLSGTDSLGFWLAMDEELYDRAKSIHTTFIPYREYITTAHIIEIKQYLAALELIVDCPIESADPGIEPVEHILFTQPGMRYCQAQALVHSLLKDEQFSALSEYDKTQITGRILEEVRGRMMEDIVLLETMKAADKDHRVFKLQFEAGEFDMVIYDQKENSCEIFEIKHSSKQVPFQYRHLVDEDKCQRTERRFGPIQGRYILYRGEDAQMENGVQYWNVENYLKALPTLDIVQVQEIGMQSIEPTL